MTRPSLGGRSYRPPSPRLERLARWLRYQQIASWLLVAATLGAYIATRRFIFAFCFLVAAACLFVGAYCARLIRLRQPRRT